MGTDGTDRGRARGRETKKSAEKASGRERAAIEHEEQKNVLR